MGGTLYNKQYGSASVAEHHDSSTLNNLQVATDQLDAQFKRADQALDYLHRKTEHTNQFCGGQIVLLEGLVKGYRADLTMQNEFYGEAISNLSQDIALLSRRVEQGFEKMETSARFIEERGFGTDVRLGGLEAQLWLASQRTGAMTA